MTATGRPLHHPSPPPDFNQIKLPVVVVESGVIFYRINSCDYPRAIHFTDTGNGRWDGSNQGYQILYVGKDVQVAFVECYRRMETVALGQLRLGTFPITEMELSKKFLAEITATKPLRFVQVYGSGLSALNADARLASGDYDTSREWGRAFYNHPANVDGICYKSRHDDDRFCYGIFDRVGHTNLTENNCGTLQKYPQAKLKKILDKYNCIRIDDTPVTINQDSVET
jgi:hypothetical protein